LDFSNPDTFMWWKSQLKSQLLAYGVDAVWNDNNEFEVDDSAAYCSLGVSVGRAGRSLQTLLMARASYEALLDHCPSKRPLVVSRSGCLGISRYAAQTWSGDNSTSFKQMAWGIPMSLGLGLCGWVGCGADVGGFTGNAVTPELFVRWIQLGIYFPRFSIHSSSWKASASCESESSSGGGDGVVDEGYNLDCTNEPWMFPEQEATVRELLDLRSRLVPFLLSLHLEAFLTSYPVMRPLVFHFAHDTNSRSRDESFEFMLGDALLVAPVLEQGHVNREVYFPGESERWCDLATGEWYDGGTTKTVNAPLQGRLMGAPVFLRSGKLLLLQGSNGDSSRDLVLAVDPMAVPVMHFVWYEDPSRNGDGRIDSRADVVKVELKVTVGESNAIRILSYSCSRCGDNSNSGGDDHLLLPKITLLQPKGQQRLVEMPEHLNSRVAVSLQPF